MKKLLLITDGFPYGEKERSFITEEYKELEKSFIITIAALSPNQERVHQWPVPEFVMNLTWKKTDLLMGLPKLLRGSVKSEINLAKEANPDNRMTVYWVRRYELVAQFYEKCLYEYIKNNSIDMVYTYWCTPATLATVRIKKKHPELKLKVVSRFHGYDLYKERTERAMWQPFRNEISEGLDLLLFVSETGKNYYKSQWPSVSDEKLMVSYLGTKKLTEETDLDNESDDILTVVSCSDCIALKRVNLIIEALSKTDESLKYKWIHVGDGPLLEALKSQATEMLGSKENISYEFTGRIPHEKIPEIYKADKADLFITTSSTEGLPVSVTEALAMGIPVVATDVGGMKELIDENDGFLINSDVDTDALAKLLDNYARQSESKKKEYSKNAYMHWVNGFDANENASELVKKLCDL